MNELWRRLWFLFRGGRFARELKEEMETHLAMRSEEYQAGGMTVEEARYAARRRFGNPAALRERSRDAWGWGWAERLGRDARHALRVLRRSPGFTAVAVLTLTLGIGGNAAIFTLLNAALLRPLPFPDPERLVLVWEDTRMFGLKDSPVALGNYTEWRAQNRVFEEMGALEQGTLYLSGAGEAQQVRGSGVTASLLRALGVQPARGRLFRDEEDISGGARTVILGDGLWRRAFGGDPGILGQTVRINDEAYQVAGVMPPGFRFPDGRNELWLPTGSLFGPREFLNKGRHNAMVVARLKPGVGLRQANEEIGAIARRLERQFPDTNTGVGAFVLPLRDHFVADFRATLMLLTGAVGFVLLIACANIANLLLSRGANRWREMAIRASIGASRGQVARQLFTENLLLAGAGGLCGLALAAWAVRFLVPLMPTGIAGISAVTVDLRVLGFTAALSLLTGMAFGLAPTLAVLRVDLHRALKQGSARVRTAGGSRGVRRGLVISQVALAFVLVCGAALFLQSLVRLRGTDPGFRSANVLTLQAPLAGRKYREPAARTAFYAEVLERVGALPGVVSAGFTNGIPLVFKGNVNGFTIEGRPRPGRDTFFNANYRVVTRDYLRTIGIPLLEGRFLDGRDRAGAPPAMLINEAMRRKFWPDQAAIGKRLRFRDTLPWITVVGVVGDMRQEGLQKPPSPEMYFPETQASTALTGLAIRTDGDPAGLAAAVRREIRAVDPDVPVTEVATMEQVLDREVFQRRAQTTLLAVFAGLALLLASLGIYGVLAYLVSQRTQEIGIRMALGAAPRDVLLAVAGQGLGWSMAGIALGAAASLALAGALSKLLFGIAPTDPATFAAVAAVLLAVALLASYLPARRAMSIDPVIALREE